MEEGTSHPGRKGKEKKTTVLTQKGRLRIERLRNTNVLRAAKKKKNPTNPGGAINNSKEEIQYS